VLTPSDLLELPGSGRTHRAAFHILLPANGPAVTAFAAPVHWWLVPGRVFVSFCWSNVAAAVNLTAM
jgi:hypothetical protein